MNSDTKKLLKGPHREKFLECFWIVTLLVSCGLFFATSFRHGKSFGIWLDNEFLISPMFNSISNQSGSNGVATYLPQFLAGLDIQGFAQFTPMYPFYFFGSSLFQTPESSIYAINVLVHLHLLIFAMGGYFLLRTLGIDRFSSAIGTILMVFNSNTLNYATWVSVLAPYAWLPWILGALFRATKRGTYGSWSLFYVFCCLLIFASPSQPMIHAFFLVLIILISEILNIRKNELRKAIFLKSLKKFLSLSPIFLAIIAPVLVPAILSIQNQVRWIGNFPSLIGHARIPFDAFLITQVELNEIINLVIPPTVPREVGGLYIGVIVIGLLLYGVYFLRSQRIWKVFFFLGVYALLSSFGNNFGLAYFNYEIPLINLLREPSRFLVIMHLSFAICAALSLNDISMKVVRQYNKHLKSSGKNKPELSRKLTTMFAAFLVISLSFGQSIWVGWKAPDVSGSEYKTGNWRDLERVLVKINQLDPSSEYRVIFGGKLNTQKTSMFSSFYGIRTLNTYINPLPFEQFNSIYFYNSMPTRYKDLLGARFLVCEECTDDEIKIYEEYEEISKFGKLKLFENKGANNYLVTPINVTHFPEGVSSLRKELELSESSDQSVFIQDNDLATPRTYRTECAPLEIGQNQFEQFSATVFCETNGVLVLNSFNDKNWRAKVNGFASTPFSVNGNLVGVNLQPGQNEVEISHEPVLRNHLFRYGGIFIAIYLLLLVLLQNRKRSFSMHVRTFFRPRI